MRKIIKFIGIIILFFIVLTSCKKEISLYDQMQKYSEKNDYEGGIIELKKMLTYDSSNPEIYYYLGSYYLILDQYQLALENYDIFFKINDDTSDWLSEIAYFDRGVVKYELGDYLGALKDLDATINKNPEDPSAYFSRAKSLMKLGLYEKACDDLDFYRDEKTLGYDPKHHIELDEDFNFFYKACDCERINKIKELRF